MVRSKLHESAYGMSHVRGNQAQRDEDRRFDAGCVLARSYFGVRSARYPAAGSPPAGRARGSARRFAGAQCRRHRSGLGARPSAETRPIADIGTSARQSRLEVFAPVPLSAFRDEERPGGTVQPGIVPQGLGLTLGDDNPHVIRYACCEKLELYAEPSRSSAVIGMMSISSEVWVFDLMGAGSRRGSVPAGSAHSPHPCPARTSGRVSSPTTSPGPATCRWHRCSSGRWKAGSAAPPSRSPTGA